MKVILLQDVPKVGRRYDIKDVPSGYARNFLIMNKLAEVATPARERELKGLRDKEEGVRRAADAETEAVLKKVDGKTVNMFGKASEAGHLFARIKEEDIAEAIKKDFNITLNPQAIILAHPIKEVGEHAITIEERGKTARISVLVTASA